MGTLIWSGRLQKNGTVVLDGGVASQGSLTGDLPGVPVMIEIESKDVGVAEPPSTGNGWKRITLRSNKNINATVTIHWRVL